MIEWGVFNDEGCIDSQMDEAGAKLAAEAYRADGDEHVQAARMCPEHEEQPADGCEECDAEIDDEAAEEE
jgi:hypothetical protein